MIPDNIDHNNPNKNTQVYWILLHKFAAEPFIGINSSGLLKSEFLSFSLYKENEAQITCLRTQQLTQVVGSSTSVTS